MPLSKILTPSLGQQAEFCLDSMGKYYFVGSGGGGGGGYGITLPDVISPTYVLGLLNSKLLDWFLKQITTKFHSGWFAYNKQFIEQIPIRLPNTLKDKKLADHISSCVEKIIKTKSKVQNNKLGDRERERFEREIEANESRIDELVCELYEVDKIPS